MYCMRLMCLLYREMQMDLELFTETYPARCVFPNNVFFWNWTKTLKYILPVVLYLQ